MGEPRITPIEIDGKAYHLARDIKVWRDEAKKFWFGDAWYMPSTDSFHWHHTAGRAGILRLLIENSCPVPSSLHIFEKTSHAHKVHDFVHNIICKEKGEDLWLRLMKIRQKEKFNPSVELMK